MKLLILLIVIFLLPQSGSTQQLQRIANPPSNEIYDLLVDKKGFLWVAHNLGISRYDGVSFTSFTNPEQSAISMTDLVEDNYGRIWCHNFNNQVFYIEHDKMNYLKGYDAKTQTGIPRMVLAGENLVLTSNNGLFMCNTATLQCRYVIDDSAVYFHNNSGNVGLINISVVGKKILALGTVGSRFKWLVYKEDGQLHNLQETAGFAKLINPSFYLKLEPHSHNDTVYCIDHSNGNFYSIVVRNDSVIPVLKTKIDANINTVSIINNKVWVNTNKYSFCLAEPDTIFNYNITSMAAGLDNRKWFGSLNSGLWTQESNTGWAKMELPFLQGKDYITSAIKHDSIFILASNLGGIFMYNRPKKNFAKITAISINKGSPANLQHARGDKFLVETGKALYILDAKTQKIISIDSLSQSYSIVVHDNFAFITTHLGLVIKDIKNWNINGVKAPSALSSFSNNIFWPQVVNNARSSLKQQRSRAITFDSACNCILAAFADGLFRLINNKWMPVLFNQKPLYISSLISYGKKVYAGSFFNGLFLIENNTVKKITTNEESQQDAIVKLKRCNNHIWVFGTHSIMLLNADSSTYIQNTFPFPVGVADVTDIEEDDSTIYLLTYNGVYTLPLSQKYTPFKVNPYLLYTIINRSDTVYNINNLSLPNNKNNLLLRFAIPVYNNAGQLHLKYRLDNDGNDADDSVWYYTNDAQRDIQFNSLKHGNYTLEVIAVQDDETISKNTFTINFSINRVWYNTWPFYTLIVLIAISFTIAIQQYRLRQVLKIERVRRKIASDLHDDIGSTLSSINVYSEIAKTENDNREYIDTIQQNTISIINNLDDLVWNINPKNDVLENMIARMRQFAEPLLADKGIECTFNIDADNLQTAITPDIRTNIYLLFKEAINNAIKHSGCTACSISILQRGKSFILTITDNGKGFDSKIINRHRNGLHNMQQRTADIKGILSINSAPGYGTAVTLTSQLN